MQKIILLVWFCAVFALKAKAVQEFETVVKDIQFNSSSRIVIDKDEIEKSHTRSLTDLLATQANISIAQSNFTPTSIYLRGGDSSHVLILVDGVPFYDASTIQRTVSLNSIDVKAVQRIEVIKGSQSVLYGGQALTGVIKIETIPKELKNGGYALAQAGNFHQSAAAAGGILNLHDESALIVRGSYQQKDDASPVLDSKYFYPSHLGTAELGYINRNQPLQYLLKAQTSFDQTFIATTASPAYSAADTNHFDTSTYQMNYTGFFSIPSVWLKPTLSVSAQQSARLFEQDAFDAGGTATKEDYKGDLLAVRYEMMALDLDRLFNLRLGASYNQEKMVYRSSDVMQSDNATEFEGFYGKAQSQVLDHFNFEAGVRSDYNQMKNETDTYQLGLTVYEDLKFEYSTGFKQPSLFQLFSAYGNQDLKPEKSTSFSASLDHKFSERFFASYTYFENRFENLIVALGSPLPKYQNVGGSKTTGHELEMTYHDEPRGTTYAVNVGYQEPHDDTINNWLVRRPLRTASVKVRQEFEKLGLGAELIHNGSRRDKTSGATYATLSSYTLLNLIADYQLNSSVNFFGRAQNVADHHYESSYGFYDEGLNIQAGMGVDF